MPHRPAPRAVREARRLAEAGAGAPFYARSMVADTPATLPMVGKGNVLFLPGNKQRIAAWNMVPTMTPQDLDTVKNLIDRRYMAADKTTTAMAEKMYKHEIVQDNIEKLKKIGYKFVGPIKGRLACGHKDIGHIAGTDDIVKEVKRFLR